MDDQNLKAQMSNVKSDNQPVGVPQVQPNVQQQVQQVPQAPVQQQQDQAQQVQDSGQARMTAVSAGKEAAPASNTADAIAIPKPPEQFIQETAQEAKLTQELQEAGVEATKSEVLQVHPDVMQAGVQPTGIATPLPSEPTLKLPMTEEKASKVLLHKKLRESITWMAALVLRQIKQIQFKRKNKKGRESLATSL